LFGAQLIRKGGTVIDQPTTGSRARIVALLRRREHTVDELAAELGVSGNAVRQQLTQLQRDGLAEATGVRRLPGAGKPATLYRMPDAAADQFSRAYAPVLAALVDELADRFAENDLVALMERTGHRLATSSPAAPDDLESIRDHASTLLDQLGAAATVELDHGTIRIEGSLCPLASAVRRRPEVCSALRAFLSAALGSPVRQCCQYGERPQCGFKVGSGKWGVGSGKAE
jgi:predicted ArsR family transcriptional regulator